MIRAAAVRILHNPTVDALTETFQRIKAYGGNAVSLIPHHYVCLQPGTPNLMAPPVGFQIRSYIWPDVGQDPRHPFHNTPDINLVWLAAKLAKSMGLAVLLKPHVDSYDGDWRGQISVRGKAADFFYAYKDHFLRDYVTVARQTGADLCIGTELYTVTKELGPSFWIDVAEWVRRQGFNNQLTYAANWGWAQDAEFHRLLPLWQSPLIDYVGVDAYFPLVDEGAPRPYSIESLLAGWHRREIDADWCPRIDDSLLAVANQAGKKLVFTEIGYPNHERAARSPGEEARPDDVRDDALQAALVTAARTRWDNEPSFEGYHWWEESLEATGPISHNLRNQPAEALALSEGGSL